MRIPQSLDEVYTFGRQPSGWVEKGLLTGEEEVATTVVESNHRRHVRRMRDNVLSRLYRMAAKAAQDYACQLIRELTSWSGGQRKDSTAKPVLRFQVVISCPSDWGPLQYCGTYVVGDHLLVPAVFDPNDYTIYGLKLHKEGRRPVGVAPLPWQDEQPVMWIKLLKTP